MRDHAKSVQAATLAARLSEECADMASVMETIQSRLGSTLADNSVSLDRSMIQLLQDMDRVTQTLADLSRLNAGLAPLFPDLDIPADLINDALTLHSLSSRLIVDGRTCG